MAYRIHTVSELTGIPRNTLIAWERRYGLVRPQRHSNHYRSYSDEDVALLKRVKEAIGRGMAVSEAIAWIGKGERGRNDAEPERDPAVGRADRAGAIFASGEQCNSAEAHAELGHESDPLSEVRSRLYEALTSYRGAEAEILLAGLLGVSADVRIHQIFFPILRQIGEKWEKGELSVAQEHYAAAIIREQMISMLVSLGRRGPPETPHAACTTAVGDHHELGALAMAVRLGQRGYRVSYLGPNLPAEELAGFCITAQPALVCVSAILRRDEPTLVDYAVTLRRLVPESTRLVIGGRGIEQIRLPELRGVDFLVNWEGLGGVLP